MAKPTTKHNAIRAPATGPIAEYAGGIDSTIEAPSKII